MTDSRTDGFAGRLKSLRNPARAFTMTSPPRASTPPVSRTGRESPAPPSRRASLLTPFRSRSNTATAAPSDELGVKPKGDDGKDTKGGDKDGKGDDGKDGHVRALSGSTVSTESMPMTPPPPAEPIAIPKAEDPTDSPHDGASIASSRSPGRLRRQVSNLSRHSLSGSIRRLSLLGPSPPQVEAVTVPAMGEIQLSRSASMDSLRRHASPDQPPEAQPAPAEPEAQPAQVSEPEPQPAQPELQPEAQPEPQPEPQSAQPAPEPVALKEPTPAPSAREPTPAPSKAPSTVDSPHDSKPAEPHTPAKGHSRNASASSLPKSPAPDKPEPKRRSTLANWARKSLDRKPSASASTPRPPSRGAVDSGAESESESIKERERRWGTGLPVPNPPTPQKSEDNIKRRFSIGRRSGEASHAKTPSEALSEPEKDKDKDKKPNWASKMLRVGKKKDKPEGASTPPDASTTDVTTEPAPEPAPEPLPALAIPQHVPLENRPLSAIVESPVMPLNAQGIWGSETSPLPAASPLGATVVTAAESPINVQGPDFETEPGTESANPIVAEPEAAITTEPEPAVEAPVAEQPKAIEPVAEPSTLAGEVEANVDASATDALLTPNSPASPPCDLNAQREIARARSPRHPSVGPSGVNRSRASPAPSIIGVKRKQPDEPDAVGKARVRYLPDWAVSPAIQLAVTLSLVLPRRRRDVANPANRKRGWWPLRRGPRTELRYNAIRGVNEEVPIVSKTWAVPAVVRTTAKVVTAPARWMFHFFVPRSTSG